MATYDPQRVLVTGGSGFLGQHVLRALRDAGVAEVLAPARAVADLRDRAAVRDLLEAARPDAVVHLAAEVGGIGRNQAEPGRLMHDTLVMGAEVLEGCRLAGVRRVVVVGTVCAYPRDAAVPFREEALFDGYPEATNAPYGIAKRAILVLGQAYRAQYGMAISHLLPTNLYGPGDHFDPATSHVIPALIRKCVEAREAGAAAVEVWGDGAATRDFLYVQDAAEGIVRALRGYDDAAPLNLGSGREVSVAALAGEIAALTGFTGALRFDAGRPAGQPRRCLDTTRARALLGWEATTPIAEGLARTVAWYEATRRAG